MDKSLATRFATAPGCTANFMTSEVSVTLPSQQPAGSHCTTRSIKCICGNDNLNLEAARRKDLRGTCRQEEITTPIPPIYVSCLNCQRYTLLFDPLIHGWLAQTNKDDESDNALRLTRCTTHPGKVYVCFIYQNEARYAQLAAAGIKNIEDYFDRFEVLVSNSGGDNLKQLLSHDCT
jgi:hypothetical protein